MRRKELGLRPLALPLQLCKTTFEAMHSCVVAKPTLKGSVCRAPSVLRRCFMKCPRASVFRDIVYCLRKNVITTMHLCILVKQTLRELGVCIIRQVPLGSYCKCFFFFVSSVHSKVPFPSTYPSRRLHDVGGEGTSKSAVENLSCEHVFAVANKKYFYHNMGGSQKQNKNKGCSLS